MTTLKKNQSKSETRGGFGGGRLLPLGIRFPAEPNGPPFLLL